MANRGWLRSALLVLLVTGAFGRAYAQVQVSVSLRPAEVIFVGDLAPIGGGAPVDLMEITLVKSTPAQESIVLTLTVTREQPTRSLVFTGTTAAFVMNESLRKILGRELLSENHDISITDYTFAEDAEALRDLLTQTGKLPAGTYTFGVDARRPTGVLLGHGESRLTLGNPSRVQLIGPGAPIGMSPPMVNVAALRFQWSTDGATPQNLYHLRIVRADGAISPEEAMQNRPAWETTTSSTSELYPGSAAAERLEAGVTYAWQVSREVRTSGGSELIQSPIYWFRATGSGVQTANITADDAFTLRMNELLKSLGLGGQLNGFKPVTVRLSDGRTIPMETLQEILAAIASGEISLISAHVR